MRTVLLLLLACAVPAFAGQTVWKWVDERGVTHFSDRPMPGATKVELSAGSRSDAPSNSSPSPASAPQAPAAPTYSSFEITEPAQDQAVINTGGQVPVKLELMPDLHSGHSVELHLDGARLDGLPQDALTHTLTGIARGSHTLQAVIVDRSGKQIRSTRAITFHVRQESAAKPPVGPALRTPPKPRPGGAAKLPTRQPSYATLNGARVPIDPETNLPYKMKPAPAGPKAGS